MIALCGISKRFGSVAALEGVDLELRPGEIHALLGENGAGKTTLMKILYGLLRPDAGEIHVNGRPVALRRPEDARRLGIGMVHQHFMLVEHMTVAENVLLGDRSGPIWRSPRGMESEVAAAARRLGFDVDPAARIESLAVGRRQRVELLKVLRRPVRTLILDEPTAVLTPVETETLFDALRRLRAEGCAVVFISHKLGEVTRLCDRVTVIRRGRPVFSDVLGRATEADLVEKMVGQRLAAASKLRATTLAKGDPLLELRGVSTVAGNRPPGLDCVNLTIRPGELVGVAGVDGNGQAALVETVLGFQTPRVGNILRPPQPPGHVADDRQREALVLSLSLAENAVLRAHVRTPFSRNGILRWPEIRRHARGLIERYAIKTPSERSPVADLSGGNQQKLVVARELHDAPPLVVAVNPTRGLDIAATQFVHEQLRARCAAGGGVLLISSDLDEILALAHRVVVLYRGRLFDTSWPAGGVEPIARRMAGLSA